MRLFFGNFGEFPFSWSSLIVDSVFFVSLHYWFCRDNKNCLQSFAIIKTFKFSSVTCWVQSWTTNGNVYAFREEDASSSLTHEHPPCHRQYFSCCVTQLSYDWLNTKTFSCNVVVEFSWDQSWPRWHDGGCCKRWNSITGPVLPLVPSPQTGPDIALIWYRSQSRRLGPMSPAEHLSIGRH